jgi:predicted nucleic acid-binding protein
VRIAYYGALPRVPYHALVVASALAADCETLYTEDLQDGQVIEERLNIRSPFKTLEG